MSPANHAVKAASSSGSTEQDSSIRRLSTEPPVGYFPPSGTESLKARTLSALSWSAGTQATGLVLRFGIMIVMARLLGPAEFGLFAMLAVFTGFARQLIGQGLGASLVQKHEITPAHLDAVFWTNVAGGLCAALLLSGCAPLIAWFYAEPALRSITVVVALNLFLSSGQVVQTVILQRRLNFRRLFWIEILTTVISGGTAILAAYRGFGIGALVIDLTVGTVTKTGLLWLGSTWYPRVRFDFAVLQQLFGFSRSLSLSYVLSYWSRNLDTLLVGKAFGDTVAGIYNRAYQLMMLPMTHLIGVVHRVMFPTLASIQHDVPRVRAIYLQATRVVSLLVFPLVMHLLVLAEPMIIFLYGEKWRASIPLFQILCPAAIHQSVSSTVAWIYLSQGRSDRQLKWLLIATPINLASFVVGMQWGVQGMAIAYVLTGYLILLYPSWAIAGKLVGLSFLAMLRNVTPTLFCALASSALIWMTDRLCARGYGPGLRLIMGGTVGFAAYGLLLIRFRVAAWQDVCGLIHGGHLPGSRWLARILPAVFPRVNVTRTS